MSRKTASAEAVFSIGTGKYPDRRMKPKAADVYDVIKIQGRCMLPFVHKNKWYGIIPMNLRLKIVINPEFAGIYYV